MNVRKLVLMIIAMCTCLSLPVVASDNSSVEEDAQSILKDLIHEFKLLRAKVAELEARLERLESSRRIDATMLNGLPGIHLRELKQVIELEPPDSDLPLGGDKGLYVFPGIDAPPLTPMDALRKRRGQ